MDNPLVCSPTGADLSSLHVELHDKLLKDVAKLRLPPRLGNVTLDVSLCFAAEAPSTYVASNICSLVKTHKYSNAYIYLHPKYYTPTPLDPSDVDKSISSKTSHDPTKVLLLNIQRAAIAGN